MPIPYILGADNHASMVDTSVYFLSLIIIGVLWLASLYFQNRRYARKLSEKSADIKELQRANKMWNFVQNFLPLHIFVKNSSKDFKFELCNKKMREFYHLDESILDKSDRDFRNGDDFEKVRNDDIACISNMGLPKEQIVKIRNFRNEEFYFHTIKCAFDDGEDENLLLGVAFDITETIRTKDTLHDLILQHNLLLDNMPGYVFTVDVKDNYRYTSFNKACLELWGKTFDEAIGKDDIELFGPDQGAKIKDEAIEAAKNDFITKTTLRFHGSDGKERIGQIFRKRIDLSDGRRLLYGFGVEVTELENAKNDLQDSLNVFNLMLKYIPCHIIAKDVKNDYAYTLCNKFFCDTFKLTPEDVIGHYDRDFFKNPDDAKRFREYDQEAVDKNCNMDRLMSFTDAEGKKRLSRAHWLPMKLSNDRFWLFIFVYDITEIEESKKRAEENAEWFRLTVSSIGDAVMTTDTQGRIVLLNSVAERMLGCKSEDVRGRPHEEFFNIISAGDELPMPSPIARSLRTGNTVELANHTVLLSATGMRYNISDSVAPIKNIDGEIIGAILVFRDVTEEYENRDKLRNALKELEYGSQLTRSASFRFDVKTKMISGTQMLGELMPIIDGKIDLLKNWVLPEDYPVVQDKMRNLYTHQSTNDTFSFRSMWSGGMRYYKMFVNMERRAMQPDVISGAIQDITEIAYSAGQLKENQELWNLVINSIPIMFFAKDANNNNKYILCNNAFSKFVGKSKDEIIGSTDIAILGSSPMSNRFIEDDKRVLESSDVPHIYDEVANDKCGNKRTIQTIKTTFTGQNGRKILIGASRDITEIEELVRTQKAMNICMQTLLKEKDFDKAVGSVLETLCTQIFATRSVVFTIDSEKSVSTILAEYADKNRNMIFHIGKQYQYTTTPSWEERFKHTELCSFFDLQSDKRGLGEVWHSLIEENKIRSFYVNRLIQNGKLWGVILWIYENERHELTSNERVFVTAFAHFIEFMLERKHSQDQILKSLYQTQKANSEKELLLANEKTLNYCLENFFTMEDPRKAVENVLKALRERFNASCCYILRTDTENKKQNLYAESFEEESFLSKYSDFPLDESEPWVQILLSGKNMLLPDLDDAEQLAITGSWAQSAQMYNVKSVYISGIYQDKKLWGDLGLMYIGKKHKSFTEQEKTLLNSAARLIEVTLKRQESRKNLINAMEQAKKADRAKSFFIASISHEIRTPLNAVIGFAELLRDASVPPDKMKEYVDSIAYSGNALLQLINDVLDLSKLEADQMVIITEQCDFKALGTEVMKVFAHQAMQNNVDLVIDIDKLPLLEIDKLRIRQILFNLIGNAVKFTQRGKVKLWANFVVNKCDKTCGTFTFGVSDTGIGIPQKDIDRLMEPFVQLSKLRGTNAVNNGTGLGLPISKRLAEKMNGRIMIESKEGEGSTFSVVLNDVVYSENVHKHIIPQTNDEYNIPADFTILIVDDVELNLKVMGAMCEKFGLKNIITLTSPVEALKLLETRKVDLILSDMWMPEMNGAQFAAKIRENQSLNNVPIIAVTADEAASSNFRLSNFSGVLLKPFTGDKMREIIRMATTVNKYNFVLNTKNSI